MVAFGACDDQRDVGGEHGEHREEITEVLATFDGSQREQEPATPHQLPGTGRVAWADGGHSVVYDGDPVRVDTELVSGLVGHGLRRCVQGCARGERPK